MMVAPGITIIVCNPYVTNLETLSQCTAVLDQYSKKWGNMPVKHGAYYFEGWFGPSTLIHAESTKKYLQRNPAQQKNKRTLMLSGKGMNT